MIAKNLLALGLKTKPFFLTKTQARNFDRFMIKKIKNVDTVFLRKLLPFIAQGIYLFISMKDDEKIEVNVKKLKNFKGKLPQYETEGASGLDVRGQLQEDIIIQPHDRALIPTGLSLEIPQSYEIQVRPRSGMAFREGLGVINSPGTIDSDYRGEVKVLVANYSSQPIHIKDQQRIAQLVLCPVKQLVWNETPHLERTKRGEKGFGSTGKN